MSGYCDQKARKSNMGSTIVFYGLITFLFAHPSPRVQESYWQRYPSGMARRSWWLHQIIADWAIIRSCPWLVHGFQSSLRTGATVVMRGREHTQANSVGRCRVRRSWKVGSLFNNATLACCAVGRVLHIR